MALTEDFLKVVKGVSVALVILYFLANPPEFVRGIPFIRVLPAMFAGGVVLFIADGIKLAWVWYRGPETQLESLELKMTMMLIIMSVLMLLSPFAEVYNILTRRDTK